MEFTTYFKFMLALAFVLGLIGVMAWGARRFGVLRGTVRAASGKRRIEIVEIAPIDSKRKLMLVRRDQTEHLLLLGATGDLVIETGIAAPAEIPGPGVQSGQTVG
ncbi:MAG: flagellar biosynthetic protein FliO [Proteobacteria bacterium]|nr:flagellar biosynthetic protein FliO [Pseudomonadota bacterium]